MVDENNGSKHIPRSSFYSRVYAEIEEMGWEHLVRSEADLSRLTFREFDKQGRAYYMELSLSPAYPLQPPSVSVDMPCHFKFSWSKKAKLKDVMDQFREHLEKLRAFWSAIEDIDRVFCMVKPEQPSFVSSTRLITLGDDCHIQLFFNPLKPNCIPECRFFGPNSSTEALRKNWRKNSGKWMSDKSFPENLATLLEVVLPGPPVDVKYDEAGETECGICYSCYLPIDDELGTSSGSSPDYTCENSSCSRAFHSLCLRDWLRSITTTRQSFDVLFGSCPYCSEAIAVKLGGTN